MSMSGGDGDITPAANPPPFPEESIVEILTWLPVKSITRFKSLSHRFLSLTAEPQFVQTHLHRRRRRSTLLILPKTFPPEDDAYPACLFDLESRSIRDEDEDEDEDEDDLVHVPDFKGNGGGHPGHWVRRDYVTLLAGSCGGLVYIKLSFCCSRPLYVLWNPATRQFRTDVEDKLDGFVPDGMECCGTSYGLGRDGATGDHKLVALNYIYYDSDDLSSCQEIVDGKCGSRFRIQPVVFSLKDNSAREVEYCGSRQGHPPPNWICQRDCAGTHVKGALYWEVHFTPGGSDDTNFLLRFDIATEGFSRVRLPESCEENEHHVEEYKDKAALFVYLDNEIKAIELWLLDHDDRWGKVLDIVGEMAEVGYPLMAVGTEEEGEEEEAAVAMKILIQERYHTKHAIVQGGLWMFDPVARQMSNLIESTRERNQSACPYRVVSKHVESLVSVYGE